MAGFYPIRNIPPLHELVCATTAVIQKGNPIVMSSGNATNAADTTYSDIMAIAAESVSSPADGRVNAWPLYANAQFAYLGASHNATSVGTVYKTTCATNACTLQTTAQVTTASGFRVLEADGTTVRGVFVNAGFTTDL